MLTEIHKACTSILLMIFSINLLLLCLVDQPMQIPNNFVVAGALP